LFLAVRQAGIGTDCGLDLMLDAALRLVCVAQHVLLVGDLPLCKSLAHFSIAVSLRIPMVSAILRDRD
jgi:hypothetical protein